MGISYVMIYVYITKHANQTVMAAFSIHQAELEQPPSMMEKQAKTPKPKLETKVKVAERPAPEESLVQPQPAQTIEGTFLLIPVTFIFNFWGFYKCDRGFRRLGLKGFYFNRLQLLFVCGFFHFNFCLQKW